jgi:hypothetical protein
MFADRKRSLIVNNVCQTTTLGVQRLLTSEVFAHVEGPCKSRDSANPVEREERARRARKNLRCEETLYRFVFAALRVAGSTYRMGWLVLPSQGPMKR